MLMLLATINTSKNVVLWHCHSGDRNSIWPAKKNHLRLFQINVFWENWSNQK